MQFTDWFCRHKVCVLYAERLVTGTALFVNLHHEQFVIRQGELGQHEYTPHRGFPVHRYQAVVCPYRFYEVLLHGRALGYFLVHHFETDIVNVERYIRTVAQGSMQVQQVIIDIKPFEQCLYAVLLATDMPDALLFFLYSVYMIRFTTSGVSPPSSFSFTNMRSPAIPPSGLSRSQSSISMESCAGSSL